MSASLKAALVAGVFALTFIAPGEIFAQTEKPGKGAAPELSMQSSDEAPAAILQIMQRVADWQLANPSKHPKDDWTQGALYTGVMALANISGDGKYYDAMIQMGETNQWKPGKKKYDADDYCVGQTYAELYMRYGDKKMIEPLREQFDDILAHPSQQPTLEYPHGKPRERWCWCDALFMGPAAWMRCYAATGDPRYLDFAVTNWWQTSEYLYDKTEHLYFRDNSYFEKREANGKKVYWSRGNGWVMGGLVRVLQYLPENHPARGQFVKQYQDMAKRLVQCQQADGLWRASLLDPDSYPLKETSGSGFYTYALAWGVNQGLLDEDAYNTAVHKGWHALIACVQADGKLTHVQPIGADPKKFDENATEAYGVGAFLLAGSEMYRLSISTRTPSVAVIVTNLSSLPRLNETVEADWTRMYAAHLGGARAFRPPNKAAVMDGVSSRIIDSQLLAAENGGPEKLIFQVSLAAGERRVYRVRLESTFPAVPQPVAKAHARLVKERFNDMAWESDRTAHRMYQQALIKGEGTVTSGIDVWSKRTRNLVVDKRYKDGHYHEDRGDGMDDYKVGRSRGCGGLAIWDGTKLYPSINFNTGRVLYDGPIRAEFELTYDGWDVAGRKVSEVKRISIDANSNFSHAESVFTSEDKSPLPLAIGVAQRLTPGVLTKNEAEGWAAYWQPTDGQKGNIECAIVIPGGVKEFVMEKASLPVVTQADLAKPSSEGEPAAANYLAITQTDVGKPYVYYFGASWSKAGDFPDAKTWEKQVQDFAAKVKQPLKVEVFPK